MSERSKIQLKYAALAGTPVLLLVLLLGAELTLPLIIMAGLFGLYHVEQSTV